MIRFILLSTFSILYLSLFAQKNKKVSIEVNYGLNGNFFFSGYDENAGPSPSRNFFKKNFIGSVGGIEIKYWLTKKSNLGIAYSRSINSRKISYAGLVNSTYVGVNDFTIRHINNLYQLYYERNLDKKISGLTCHLGLFYVRPIQQEVELAISSNAVGFDERKYKNNRLEEGGIFGGFQYLKKIDTKFELGIKSRIYYTISTNTLEIITLTPTLIYNF